MNHEDYLQQVWSVVRHVTPDRKLFSTRCSRSQIEYRFLEDFKKIIPITCYQMCCGSLPDGEHGTLYGIPTQLSLF